MAMQRVAAIQASLAAAADDLDQTQQTLDEDKEDDLVIEIERLQSLGITSTDISRLKSAGLFTISGVKMRSKKVRPSRISTAPHVLAVRLTDHSSTLPASHGDQRNDRTQNRPNTRCL